MSFFDDTFLRMEILETDTYQTLKTCRTSLQAFVLNKRDLVLVANFKDGARSHGNKKYVKTVSNQELFLSKVSN